MKTPPEKTAVEATVDSVGSAIGMLWDWLTKPVPGEPPPQREKTAVPSVLDLIPDDAPKKDAIIDTEGEEA